MNKRKLKKKKKLNKKKNFLECIQLLDRLVAHGVIHRDPYDYNRILVYRSAGQDPVKNPEGWYSQNLMSAASELCDDKGNQKFLENVLLEEENKHGADESYGD